MEFGYTIVHVPDAESSLAIFAAAFGLSAPSARPWGQVVSYVRCPDGTLVELCAPMGQ